MLNASILAKPNHQLPFSSHIPPSHFQLQNPISHLHLFPPTKFCKLGPLIPLTQRRIEDPRLPPFSARPPRASAALKSPNETYPPALKKGNLRVNEISRVALKSVEATFHREVQELLSSSIRILSYSATKKSFFHVPSPHNYMGVQPITMPDPYLMIGRHAPKRMNQISYLCFHGSLMVKLRIRSRCISRVFLTADAPLFLSRVGDN